MLLLLVCYLRRSSYGNSKPAPPVGALDDERLMEATAGEGGECVPDDQRAGERT